MNLIVWTTLSLLIFIAILYSAKSQDTLDVQYISTLSGDQYCVATGNDTQSIISWDYWNSNDKDINKTASIQPNLDHLRVNCKFDDISDCTQQWVNKFWKLKSSTDFTHGLVLDRRWEDLTAIQTVYCNWENYNIENSDDFEVPISIRAPHSAHIYLCGNSANSGSGNCYRIIIGGWNNTRTLIKKCFYDGSYNPIAKDVAHYNHSDDPILSDKEWNHFVIRVKNYHFTIEMAGRLKPLLEWTDDSGGEQYPTKTVFVCIKGIGEFKIHKYNLIHSTSPSIQEVGNFQEYQHEDTFCISMFVLMCQRCTLKFTLGASADFASQTEVYQGSQWREVTFSVDISMVKGKEKRLFIETTSKSDHPFWAIREVRSCSNKDFRLLKYSPSYKIAYNPQCLVTKSTESLSYKTHTLSRLQRLSPKNIYLLPTISEFEAYDKGVNFVSLRWKGMNPSLYGIFCTYENQACHGPSPEVAPCKIWPNFYCANFEQLTENIDYTFSIQAYKDGFNGFHIPPVTIIVNTNSQVPSPPLELEAYFQENNTLVVNWKHPKKINGPLKYFLVEMQHFINDMYRPFYEEKYDGSFEMLNFSKSVLPPTNGWGYYSKLRLAIRAVNDKGFSDYSNITIDTPPKIPTFGGKKIVLSAITPQSVTINIPNVKFMDDSHSSLFIIISTSTGNYTESNLSELHETMKKKCEIPKSDLNWVAYAAKLNDVVPYFVIGNGEEKNDFEIFPDGFSNKQLESDTLYEVCVVLMNEYHDLRRYHTELVTFRTNEMSLPVVESQEDLRVSLRYLALLIIPVLLFVMYICYKRQKQKRKNPDPYYRRVSQKLGQLQTKSVYQQRTENNYLTPLSRSVDQINHIYEEIQAVNMKDQYDHLEFASANYITNAKQEPEGKYMTIRPQATEDSAYWK